MIVATENQFYGHSVKNFGGVSKRKYYLSPKNARSENAALLMT